MGFITITEDEAKGERIPDDAEFTIVSIQRRGGSKHGHSEIVTKGRATGSIGVNLDPGTYRICVNSLGHQDEEDRLNWVREFTVGTEAGAGLTPEQMKKLSNMKPKWAKPIHSSDGARWNCQFPGGCRHRATSVIGAVVHEYKEHLGMDPLKAGKAEVKEAAVKATRAV